MKGFDFLWCWRNWHLGSENRLTYTQYAIGPLRIRKYL